MNISRSTEIQRAYHVP